jgi:hypothetical protein
MKFSLVSGCTLFTLGFGVATAFAQPHPDPATGEPPPPDTTTPDPLASPPPPPPPPPNTNAPATPGVPAEKTHGAILPNMLPSRLGATIDFRADYTAFNDEGLGDSDPTVMGFNLYGQYLLPEGYGGYASIPYYYVDKLLFDDSDNGAGNIEIGGLYRIPQNETQELLLRVGVALDTAGQLGGAFAPISQLSPRFYDAYTAGLGATWFKGEGSFRLSQGNLRLAASAGIDLPVGRDDDEDDFDAIGKAAVSAGFDQGSFGAGVGFVLLYALGAPEGSDDETSMGVNATINVPINPATAIYGAFGWPAIDDNDDLDIFAIGVGVRAAIL